MIFENRYISDDNKLREICDFLYLKRPERKWFLIIYAFFTCALTAYVCTMDIIYVKGLSLWSVGTILIAGACLVLVLTAHRRYFKMQKKRRLETSGTQDSEILRRVEDGVFTVEDLTTGSREAPYKPEIKRVYESKDSFFLMTGARWVMLFPKDAFTVGNAEEFREFFRSRGAKIRKF